MDVVVKQATGQSSMCSSEYGMQGKQERLEHWVVRRPLVVVESDCGCSGSNPDLEHKTRAEEHST